MLRQLLPLRPLTRTGSLGPLSEQIIPATPGKNYVYSSTFTDDRPIFALLDCKANKSRALADLSILGREANLHFAFDGANHAIVSSIKLFNVNWLIGDVNVEFDEVFVAPADVAIEDFYNLSARRDSTKLIETCQAACKHRKAGALLAPGKIIAVLTSGHKYCLFLVKELTPTSASIDAYHILAL